MRCGRRADGGLLGRSNQAGHSSTYAPAGEKVCLRTPRPTLTSPNELLRPSPRSESSEGPDRPVITPHTTPPQVQRTSNDQTTGIIIGVIAALVTGGVASRARSHVSSHAATTKPPRRPTPQRHDHHPTAAVNDATDRSDNHRPLRDDARRPPRRRPPPATTRHTPR